MSNTAKIESKQSSPELQELYEDYGFSLDDYEAEMDATEDTEGGDELRGSYEGLQALVTKAKTSKISQAELLSLLEELAKSPEGEEKDEFDVEEKAEAAKAEADEKAAAKSREKLGGTIAAAVGKIGSVAYDHIEESGLAGMNHQADAVKHGTYCVGYFKNYLGLDRWIRLGEFETQAKAEADNAKQILQLAGDALKAKDEKGRNEKWAAAIEAIQNYSSQIDKVDGGSTNNMAQLVFNTLYGELGEAKFKAALSEGMIPTEFSRALAGALEIRIDENDAKSLESEITDYQQGGPGWTHKRSAHFLNNFQPGAFPVGSDAK